MAGLSYLTRRGGGRYYLQIRMPAGAAWPVLLRLSLRTSDPKVARHSLCSTLAWLMPIRDAESLTRQAEEVLAQCRRFARAGPAATWPELDDRRRFEHAFSAFARDVRHYNVPDEVRLPLLGEWAFFLDMLRRDEVRLYEAGPDGRRAPEAPAPLAAVPTGQGGDGDREASIPDALPARGRRQGRMSTAAQFQASGAE